MAYAKILEKEASLLVRALGLLVNQAAFTDLRTRSPKAPRTACLRSWRRWSGVMVRSRSR
jgi:hypothetical protein